jgi:hypothetical protein
LAVVADRSLFPLLRLGAKLAGRSSMSKFALKFLVTASTLRRSNRRTNWGWMITISSTLVTAALVALYLLQRGTIG